jgi:hypothetical protein
MNGTKKTIEVNFETVRAALEKAVAERGSEFRYTDMFESIGCLYWSRPKDKVSGKRVPACLVGMALSSLDPSLGRWLSHNNCEAISWIVAQSMTLETIDPEDEFVVAYGENTEFVFEGRALLLLALTQRAQDAGVRWGRALSGALLAPGVES